MDLLTSELALLIVLNRKCTKQKPATLESFQADGARILEPVSAGPGQTVAAGAKATDWVLDASKHRRGTDVSSIVMHYFERVDCHSS